jgi:polar amino acid transport system substrate-binding protein
VKPSLFSICLRGLAAGACALAVGAAAAPPGHVQVLVEDAASPWSNHDGAGYANDLVRAAFHAAGVSADLVVVPYARCKALVMRGGAVACFSMSAAPELGKLVRFADKPLFSVTPRIYYNPKHRERPKSLADLKPGMRVGIVRGYEYPPFVQQLAAHGVLFDSAPSDVINLRKLAVNRLDAALIMTDEMRSATMIQQQAGVSDIAAAFQARPMESFIGFSTLNPDGDAQRRRFNAGFETIGANGVRQEIQAQWKARCAKFCPE